MAEPQRVLPARVTEWQGQSWISESVLRDLYGYDTQVGLVIEVAPRTQTGAPHSLFLELEAMVAAINEAGEPTLGWWVRRIDPDDVSWDLVIRRLLSGT